MLLCRTSIQLTRCILGTKGSILVAERSILEPREVYWDQEKYTGDQDWDQEKYTGTKRSILETKRSILVTKRSIRVTRRSEAGSLQSTEQWEGYIIDVKL